jgi:ribosomal-protein-alanine N-acetyltransferase
MSLLIELNPGNIDTYIDRLMEIENEAFARPWSRVDYLTEVRRPISHLLAIVEGDKLLAYAGFWQVVDEAEINNVAVAAEWRGKGLGKSLMLGVLDMARLLGCMRVNLEVRQSNAAAISVYEKCGFKAVGVRPGYYEDNHEDAVLMSANLLQ